MRQLPEREESRVMRACVKCGESDEREWRVCVGRGCPMRFVAAKDSLKKPEPRGATD